METPLKFDFGSGPCAEGHLAVAADTVYGEPGDYGFSGRWMPRAVGDGEAGALLGDACVSEAPFTFAVDLPEGNYRVTAILGHPGTASTTTVKAEARRLMVGPTAVGAGESRRVGFVVNNRTPRLPDGGSVRLTGRESGPPVVAHWNGRLEVEFVGSPAAVMGLTIEAAPDLPTVFLAGDSTVTDQPSEPWAAWGQILPFFFKPDLAIANHAESGRALYSFRGEHRLDKILASARPGDFLIIQFGHNDQKNKAEGAGPFTSYTDDLESFVNAAREAGMTPVLVSPMERRRWRDGKPYETLGDYAEAVRRVGAAEGVPVIDLHAMSLELYTALGEQGSKQAFVHYPAGQFPGQRQPLSDDTHHSVYGSYELARAVVEGIRSGVPELAKHLKDGIPPFDPSRPDTFESVRIPRSVPEASETPEGS